MILRAVACLCMAALLPARDLYLIPESFFVTPDQHLRISIHAGEKPPLLDQLRDTDQITSSAIYGMTYLHATGQSVDGETLLKAKGILVLTARTLPAVDQFEAAALHAYLQNEGLTHALSQQVPDQGARLRHSGYAKALIQSESADEFFNHVVGFLIEIVPEKNPYILHAGDELPVQVLFAGKPAPDLKLEAVNGASTLSGRTAADGRITFRINSTGQWRLHTTEIHKCTELTLADWETLTASLTFEIR